MHTTFSVALVILFTLFSAHPAEARGGRGKAVASASKPRPHRCTSCKRDVVPLKQSTPDTPANMQWEAIAEAKAKDKIQ
jgi:hypothetical protein